MAPILTFALVAPLGAMGGIAVGERRPGWDRPARSAVLGLVAACLGLARAEEEAHAELAAGLGVALRREGPAGSLLADYHTAQAGTPRRGQVGRNAGLPMFATRREELSGSRETVLSRRDYRADPGFTAALWRRPTPAFRWTLDALAAAMREPGFVPYFGRKSCPLGLPLAPLVVEAETVVEALLRRDEEAARLGWPEREAMTPRRRGRDVGAGGGTLWADLAGPEEPRLGVDHHRVETRRDAPLGRCRPQFGLREEAAADWRAPPS